MTGETKVDKFGETGHQISHGLCPGRLSCCCSDINAGSDCESDCIQAHFIVGFHGDFCNHPEARASTTESPEEISVVHLVGNDKLSSRCDDFKLESVVRAKAKRVRKRSMASTEKPSTCANTLLIFSIELVELLRQNSRPPLRQE